MNELLLSIAVFVYNQESYIAQTLESIIEQNHNYLYEIIIGDDYSTDGTRDVLLKYKKKYPDIINLVLNENNLGLLKNYFNIINRCSGKYIMQCAGDDYWLPGKVSTQIAFMEDNPDIGMCCGNVQLLKSNVKKVVWHRKEGYITFEELIKWNRVVAMTACFKRKLIIKYTEAIEPLEKGWLTEDYPTWLWFSINSKIYNIDEFFGVYRIIENSASHPTDSEKKFNFLYSILDIKKYFTYLYNNYSYDISKEENKLNIAKAIYYKDQVKYIEYIANKKSFKGKIKHFIGKNKVLFYIYRLWFLFQQNKKY